MSISPRSSFTDCKLETIPGGFVITATGNCLTQPILRRPDLTHPSEVWLINLIVRQNIPKVNNLLGKGWPDQAMAMIPKTSPELRTQPWPGAGKWVACSPSCVGPARSPRAGPASPGGHRSGFWAPGTGGEERPGPGDSDGLSGLISRVGMCGERGDTTVTSSDNVKS